MAEADTQNLPAPQPVLDRIPGARQLVLLAGVAAAVAAGVGLVFWSQGPTYAVLFPDLAMGDAAEVVRALDDNAVEYKMDSSGAILVPAGKVQEATLLLAGMGLPSAANHPVSILNETGGMGGSTKIEQERLHRAREQYLVDTIVSFSAVQNARIHLAMPENSPFARERKPASASVFLQLHPGRELSQNQVAAISHLVASSTPNLEKDRVTVVDSSGRLLTHDGGVDDSGMSETQFEMTREKERELTAKVENLLTPVLGRGRVRAEVAVEMDFTRTEETRETFDSTPIVRSEEVRQESRTQRAAEGVPGALTNQPPETAPAAVEEETAAEPVSTSSYRRSNNDFGKSITYVKNPMGSIKRLSVAVVLDNRVPAGAEQEEPAALSDAELAQITELIKHAVGFDEDRGDILNVLNAPFVAEPELAPPEEIPMWKQPWLMDMAKQGVGVLLLLALVITIVRPLMRSLAMSAQPGVLPGGAHPGLPPLAADQISLSGQGGPATVAYENPLTAARSMAGQDPKRVAQVVKGWVANDG